MAVGGGGMPTHKPARQPAWSRTSARRSGMDALALLAAADQALYHAKETGHNRFITE